MKPIPPTTASRSTDRTTSRTNQTGLKPAEDFFFPFPPFPLNCSSFLFFLFLLPPILYLFYAFFLPSFIYSFVLICVKIPCYLASDLSLFPLPSFLFLFPFSLLPFFYFYCYFFILFFDYYYSPPLSLFPTGETTKPGVLKRLELDLSLIHI